MCTFFFLVVVYALLKGVGRRERREREKGGAEGGIFFLSKWRIKQKRRGEQNTLFRTTDGESNGGNTEGG